MSRRRFIGKLSTALKMALGFQLLPRMARAAADTKEPAELHYRPLNGDILREMGPAEDAPWVGHVSESHGACPETGGSGRCSPGSCFTKNAYAGVLDDQPISPVTIDWEPIKAHRGVSVTFIKHSTLLIKDVDRVLLCGTRCSTTSSGLSRIFSPRAFSLEDMPPPGPRADHPRPLRPPGRAPSLAATGSGHPCDQPPGIRQGIQSGGA